MVIKLKLTTNKNIKKIRFILTAYSVNNNEYLKDKNIYYVYKRKLD